MDSENKEMRNVSAQDIRDVVLAWKCDSRYGCHANLVGMTQGRVGRVRTGLLRCGP